MKQELAPLYSKSRKGDILEWRVRTEGDLVVVESGKHGYKMTTHKDRALPTNLGQANQRLGDMQAEFEAVAAWEKKKKEGYFETINEAQTAIVKLPMLAHPIMKTSTKGGVKTKVMRNVEYPVDVQCKLNGVRCLAEITPLGVQFTSREGEHWGTLTHIASTLRALGSIGDIYDGEIYVHGVPLQDINSYIKRAQEGTQLLAMHIYDMPMAGGHGGGSWEERLHQLRKRFGRIVGTFGSSSVQLVQTVTANNYDEVQAMGAIAIAQGYEGLILRQRALPYEWNNRCESLLKWKQFQDGEFEVVGGSARELFLEQKKPGDPASMMILDKFVVKNNLTDATFEVVPRGTMEQRRAWLAELPALRGQFLTVRYLERSKDGIPQGNPVGLGFRLSGDLPQAEENPWG